MNTSNFVKDFFQYTLRQNVVCFYKLYTGTTLKVEQDLSASDQTVKLLKYI